MIVEKLLIKSRGRPHKKLKTFKNIIVHWTGPYPGQSPDVVRSWWETSGLTAAAHYIIKDDTIMQTIPDDEIAWHAGDTRNDDSIGIEVIPENAEGRFSDKSIKSLKYLISVLKTKYGDLTIQRHYDGTQKKDCPRYYTPHVEGGRERWEKLLEDLWNM